MISSPTGSARNVLREMVAAMNERQITLAANKSEIARASLVAFAEGRSRLEEASVRRLADHLYRGAFFIKAREDRDVYAGA